MRKVKSILIILLVLICVAICVSCTPSENLMDGYDDFINNPQDYVGQTPEKPGDSDQISFSKAEEIAGLNLIGQYEYEGGIDFFGDFAFVTEKNEVYLLKNDGTISKFIDSTSRDIVIISLKCDKIIGKSNEKLGVIDLDSNIVVNFEYDYIDIADDLILAKTDNKGFVYKNGNLVGEINKDGVIVNKDLIVSNGKYYNACDLTISKIGDNFVMSAPYDDVVRIVDKSNNYGFAKYSTGEILIEPRYQLCDVMKENVFCAYNYGADEFGNFKMEYPKLINAQNELFFDFSIINNEITFDPTNITIYPASDGFVIFHINAPVNLYGYVEILTGEYELLYNIEVKDCFVRKGKIITEFPQRIYDIKSKQFITQSDEVAFCDGYYIVKSGENYKILSENMTVLVENCQEITYSNGIFRVKRNNKFAYYKVN
ncbi:MAG: hypothetical protein IJX06_03080 [Clostridia bacterium]|nr:hypothetical protein [Clostridia bacterium]